MPATLRRCCRPGRCRFSAQSSQREAGQISLLVLCYTLIAFAVVAVVVDATAVHLARTQLLDAADAAALDAADALDSADSFTADFDQGLPLAAAAVRRQADKYVADYPPPSRLDQIRLGAGTGTSDGRSATVEMSGRVRLPVAAWVVASFSQGITVTVTSTARADVEP